MVHYLQEIAADKDNKMTEDNLAIVLSPNMLRCPSESLPTMLTNSLRETLFLETLLKGYKE